MDHQTALFLAYCAWVSSEEIMCKCDFSRLELPLRKVQFMLHETREWVAAGEAHQGAGEAGLGEL